MKDNRRDFDESIEKDKHSGVTIEIIDGNKKEEKADVNHSAKDIDDIAAAAGDQAGADSQTDADVRAKAADKAGADACANADACADADKASGGEAEKEAASAKESDDGGEAADDSGADAEDADSDDDAAAEDAEACSKEDGTSSGSFFKKNKKTKPGRILEKELKKAEAAAADLTDRYQRLMAEFENARKRMDKEKGQMYDIGAKSVLEKLLPVVDNFERGLSALSEEEKQEPFAQGIEKIYQQMMTAFTDLGVTPMDAVGKEFNPDLHNAVMHVEDEELPDNVVVEEFQKGYMYKDSVLRYSMVKVAN